MAYAGKKISNRHTGQSILFLQTARDTEGQLLEMESSFAPFSKEPAPHFHPYQHEVFTVISGELTVRMEDRVIVLTPGQQLEIPRYKVHAMWNNSSRNTVVNWKVSPALETEEFLENAMGLAHEGRINSNGMPSLLQVALMARRYEAEFRLSKPSPLVQKLLFTVLKPFALLAGYQASYKKYID